MENAKRNEVSLPQQLTAEEATSISGGDGALSCTTTFTTGTGGTQFTTSGSTPGDVLIGVYDGVVDLTSHIIERVASVAK